MGANLQRCLKASTAVQVVEVAGRRGHKEHELGRESFVYGLSLSTSSIPSPSEYPAVTEDYDTPMDNTAFVREESDLELGPTRSEDAQASKFIQHLRSEATPRTGRLQSVDWGA